MRILLATLAVLAPVACAAGTPWGTMEADGLFEGYPKVFRKRPPVCDIPGLLDGKIRLSVIDFLLSRNLPRTW